MTKNNALYFIGGNKGGTGKSMVSMSIIDFLLQHEKEVFLVETDSANPDVLKAYQNTIQSKTLDLDRHNDWVELVNLIDEKKDYDIVINTGARNSTGLKQHGPILNEALPDLRRTLQVLWVINTQMDSLILLKEFMSIMPSAQIAVLRNMFFGNEAGFKLYNESNIKVEIEKIGGKSLLFPSLASRVSAHFYGATAEKKRITIAEGLEPGRLLLGDRVELGLWRNTVARILREIENG